MNQVGYCAAHIQHMQKALSQMNLLLHNVVSEITGVTGMRIIKGILDGKRDAKVLAGRRDKRCKNSVETIAKSLEGNYHPEHLFGLQQAVETFECYQTQIAMCDREIETLLSTFDARIVDGKPEQPGTEDGTSSRANGRSCIQPERGAMPCDRRRSHQGRRHRLKYGTEGHLGDRGPNLRSIAALGWGQAQGARPRGASG